MSAAEVAERDTQPPSDASGELETLQDILYDMLATGIDESTRVSQAEIEGFLHEHARAAKPVEEFRAFFERHGLSLQPEHESAILELPPITTPREPERVTAEKPIELALADIEEIPWKPPAPPSPPWRARWTRPGWLVSGALAIALIVVAFFGYGMIRDLRADLSRASERHQRDHTALQRLSDQAANLESSVAATGELLERVDQKSDLLLDSVLREKTSPAVRKPVP